MDMTTFGAIVVTIAVSTLYLMALKANARANRAEAALARVEAVIADTKRLIWLKTEAKVPNALAPWECDPETGVCACDPMTVYLDGAPVRLVYGYNIAQGWVDVWESGAREPVRKRGVVTVKLGEVAA